VIAPIRFNPLSGCVLCAVIIALLASPTSVQSAPTIAAAARMRPYAGIGVLMLPVSSSSGEETYEALQRYDEPGIYRRGELDIAQIPRHEWVFGSCSTMVSLVVMAKKAGWL
jgi:hypothetical protein